MKAVGILGKSEGCSFWDIVEVTHTFEPHELPDPSDVKTFLKLAVDVHILEKTEDGKYKFFQKKIKSRKRKRNSLS